MVECIMEKIQELDEEYSELEDKYKEVKSKVENFWKDTNTFHWQKDRNSQIILENYTIAYQLNKFPHEKIIKEYKKF